MIMTIHTVLASCCLILLSISITTAFTTVQPRRIAATTTKLTDTTIVSPFDESTSEDGTTTTATKTLEGPLDLTWDNVELVLDEMRHFLIQDGGNVIISEIDGPVVRLELQVRKRYNVLLLTFVHPDCLFVCLFICVTTTKPFPIIPTLFVGWSKLSFLCIVLFCHIRSPKMNYCSYFMIQCNYLLAYLYILGTYAMMTDSIQFDLFGLNFF